MPLCFEAHHIGVEEDQERLHRVEEQGLPQVADSVRDLGESGLNGQHLRDRLSALSAALHHRNLRLCRPMLQWAPISGNPTLLYRVFPGVEQSVADRQIHSAVQVTIQVIVKCVVVPRKIPSPIGYQECSHSMAMFPLAKT